MPVDVAMSSGLLASSGAAVAGAAGAALMTPAVVQWQTRLGSELGWQVTGTTLEVWCDGHLSPGVADELLVRAVELSELLTGGVAGQVS